MADASERRERLKAVWEDARGCTACALHESRTTVVFGAGNANADLMFVGEAPGANEDAQGLPFVGRAGQLLEQLLGEIGLERKQVFIANALKCRPPGNRDPQPNEIETCAHYLHSQVELIEPKVICTLGNFSTKLLRGDPTGISRLHGQDEVRMIGPRAIRLLPLYHPAAALYAPSTLQTLRDDFAKIPALLAQPAPPQPAVTEIETVPEPADSEPWERDPGPETDLGPGPEGPPPEIAGHQPAEDPLDDEPGPPAGDATPPDDEPQPPGDQLGLF